MTYLPPANGGRINANITGNTAAVGTVISNGTMVLAGGNNVTLSQAGSTITISGAAAAAAASNTLGMSNLGNSIGTSGVISGSALRFAFAGGNNVTLSQSLNASSGTITISAANQSIQTQNLVSINGSTGNITFNNANNVTFGGNASAITASASFNQSAQTQSNIQAVYDGANSISTGTIRYSNSNGVSFGINGQTLTASHNGITSQTNQTLGLYAVSNTTGESSASTMDARSLSFQGAGIASVGYSGGSVVVSVPSGGGGITNVNLSAGTTSNNLSNMVFSNSNGVSFGLNGSTVTASHNGITSQSVQTQGLQTVVITSNTSGATASISSGAMTLAGGNNITLSQAGNAITISGANGGGGGGIAAVPDTVASTFSSGTVNFADAGGGLTISASTAGAGQTINFSVPNVSSLSATGAVSISTNGSTISIGVPMFNAGISNIGNTSGTSGTNTNGLILAGGNNITLSQSTNAAGATVTISGGAGGGGGGATLSRWEAPDFGFSSLNTVPQGSLSLQRVFIPFNVTGSAMKIAGSLTGSTNTSATTASVNYSLWMGIYSLNGSTLSLASSGSANNGFQISQTASTTANSLTIPGLRQMTVPMNVNMTPGEYWIGAAMSTASTYTGAGFSLYGNTGLPTASGAMVITPIGSSTAAANRDVILFQGVYTAQTSAGPVSIVGSQINNTSASNVQRAAFYHAIYNATY